MLMEGIFLQLLLLLLLNCFSSQLFASSDVKFYEPFDETFEGRWTVSDKVEYEGVWKHAKSKGHDDYGLLVSEKARKYAIVKEVDENVHLGDGTVVLQYEVRLQEGLECGGAYIKYLRPQDAGWTPKDFSNESPYTIMFGPDRCGSTNKVHFILNHKSPKTGEYVEHHLLYPPAVPQDDLSHVYTAILKANSQLSILIDGEEAKKYDILSDHHFDPPLIPAETIPDPDDKMPEDWDDKERIPDPNATKPDDWDENAPMEIEDEEAEKPEGWLDDEPTEVDDPESTKPEDWDDDEDGEWEAPKMPNLACDFAPGCGEWKRPMKKNPAYRGKWYAPFIDNPNYKGVWEPRSIPNPNYYKLEKLNLDPIAAIGIEIWTMQAGILFDNILITSDEKVAESYRDSAWKPKFLAEKEKQRAKGAATSGPLQNIQKTVFSLLYKIADIPFLSKHQVKILDLIEKAETQPTLTLGVLVATVVIIVTILIRLVSGGQKKPAPRAARPKKDVVPKSNSQSSDEKEEPSGGGGPPPPRKRNTRREN